MGHHFGVMNRRQHRADERSAAERGQEGDPRRSTRGSRRGMSGGKRDQARLEIVHGADDPDRPRALEVGQHFAPPPDAGHRQRDVLPRYRVHELEVLRRALARGRVAAETACPCIRRR